MKRRPSLTASQAEQRATWQYRAIEATRGNQSQLGALILAILGKAPDHPPRFGSGGVITSDGYLTAHFQDKAGDWHMGAFVGSVEDFVNNLRGLSEHLKLTDRENNELFAEAKKWITHDYRALATDELGNPKKEN